ncbi:Barwin-like endoglucanases protein [Dioscorea alata]|uniref:Barwin-like endoglucanases protein n=1 Tax=Dioscorea alata TaxID=55571 RepID=A0ACB7WKQ9_DIOAL|nr:Barwin-like endoglucanases protein [Dioscorea alata]
MIAAGSHEIFDDGRACGHLFKVKCIAGTNNGVAHPCRGSGTVVVKLVDLCPSGCQGTIDLSQEAFAKIADPDAGKIEVSIERHVLCFISDISSIRVLLVFLEFNV